MCVYIYIYIDELPGTPYLIY